MQLITVREGQTSIDIGMQYTGDAANAVAVSIANGLSITDDLNIGSEMICDDAVTDKKKYAATFSKYNVTPASAVNNAELLEGIGYWIIEQDFVVS